MGAALCRAALDAGFNVTVVSGPVEIDYPAEAQIVRVVSTAEMLDAAKRVFGECVGAIGVAAPCDFTPVKRSAQKMTKEHLTQGAGDKTFALELTETPDIMAALGAIKQDGQWTVAFALETNDHDERARKKLSHKQADLIVLNRPSAIGGQTTEVEILDANETLETLAGDKQKIAKKIIAAVLSRFPF